MSDYLGHEWAAKTGVDLQPYNTLALPVQAQHFCYIRQLSDLYTARDYCRQHQLDWLLLGGGSNMVLTDDVSGLVMHMAMLGKCWVQPNQLQHPPVQSRDDLIYICVGAGENWDQLVAWSIAEAAYGLQNLSLIPGLVGAAPIQNIGAYGVELAHVLHELMVFDFATGEQFCLTAEQCELGYRNSIFKRHPQWLVTSVTLALSRQPQVQVGYGEMASYLEQNLGCTASRATPQQVRDAVIYIRTSKLPDPAVIPNVGSFFKNPVVAAEKAAQIRAEWPDLVAYAQPDKQVKVAAGWLIDQLGWRGYMREGVGVHAQQALVLILESTAPQKSTGLALLKLAQQIQADVEQHFGIHLAVEPRLFGKTGEIQIDDN